MTAAARGAAVPADVREASGESSPPLSVTTHSLTELDQQTTRRWYGIGALSMLLLGVGAVLLSPALVLTAALGLAMGLYYRLLRPPTPELAITRTVSDSEPEAGDEIEVTLTIENVGDDALFDLRVVEGIPPALEVVEGHARLATALRPGQTAQLSYQVEVGRGHQAFEATTLIVRDIAGATETVYEAEVETALLATLPEDPLPPMALRALTSGMTGRVEVDEGGPGVEFYAVREYRPGDPLNRIDWNRRARSGELATVDFRREQMATVMLVIDLRPAAYVSRPEADEPATDTCIEAAARVFAGLLDAGDRVGITTLGDRDCWLPPRVGADHREHGRILFNAHPALGSRRPGGSVSVITEEWELDHRIPDSTQLVFFSPMADGGAARYVTRFESRGHPVTVISPDPTGTETAGQTVATIERQLRLGRLRERGVRVVDWHDDRRPLAAALEVAAMRWSA